MSRVRARAGIKRQTVHAVITRADGTVEDLGCIHYQHANLFKHVAVNALIKLKEIANGRARSK